MASRLVVPSASYISLLSLLSLFACGGTNDKVIVKDATGGATALPSGGGAGSGGVTASSGAGGNEAGGASGGKSGRGGAGGGPMTSPAAGSPAGGASGAGGARASGGAPAAGGTAATPGVSISPTVARVDLGGDLQFTGMVSGIADHTINWSVQEGANAGSVDATGHYTAPATAGRYHVQATAAANNALMATAEVAVTAPQGTAPTLTAGVWLNITPPIPGLAQSFGTTALEISPVDPKTIYVSSDMAGLWRTTDAGSTWAVVGDASKPLQSGSTTTQYLDSPVRVEVDPGNPDHLFATQGVRGASIGFWESQNAGTSWSMPKGFVDIAAKATSDVTAMALDPNDFKHMLLGSHSPWAGTSSAGILETKDGGASWTMHQPPASWPAGSLGIAFLYDPPSNQGDSNTWLASTDGNGFWRTEDAGANWTQVTTNNAPHGGAQIYYAKNGWIYSGAAFYPMRSKDNGKTWESLQDSGLPYNYYITVCGDGNVLYTQASGATMEVRHDTFWTSAETDGSTWTQYQGGTQTFGNGPAMMRFDSANGILYAADWAAGVWALKVLK